MRFFRVHQGLYLCLLISSAAQAGPVPTGKPAAYPDWWFERDVIPRLSAAITKPNPAWPADYPVADDFAAVNVGQLKHIASKAAAQLNASPVLLDGAGSEIASLIAAWNTLPPGGVTRDDFATANQGQVKNVAKLYYDRLASINYAGAPLAGVSPYPWSLVTTDDDAYALVNLGQLKRIFSFRVRGTTSTSTQDSDFDQLPDEWELIFYPSLGGVSASSNADGDALSALQEFQLGTSPTAANSVNTSSVSLSLQIYTP